MGSRYFVFSCRVEFMEELITSIIKFGMKSLIHSETSTVEPLKFGIGYRDQINRRTLLNAISEISYDRCIIIYGKLFIIYTKSSYFQAVRPSDSILFHLLKLSSHHRYMDVIAQKAKWQHETFNAGLKSYIKSATSNAEVLCQKWV